MKTDNRNINCVVDVETTGLNDTYHEICQIAVVILDPNLNPTDKIFYRNVRPIYINRCDMRALKVNKMSIENLLSFRLPCDIVQEFENFFEENVPEGKQLAPMGHNYCFDRGFLKNFFGVYPGENGVDNIMYDDFFFRRYRDTMNTAIFINDLAERNGQLKVPFPKVSLSYLCNVLNVENPKAHTALSDAIATAKCYQKMIEWYLGSTPFSF